MLHIEVYFEEEIYAKFISKQQDKYIMYIEWQKDCHSTTVVQISLMVLIPLAFALEKLLGMVIHGTCIM